MKTIVEVRNVKLGEGKPKICVPLVGSSDESLLEEVSFLKTLKADIVEWRIDYYKNVEKFEAVKKILSKLRAALGELPLLVTFRTKKEGGEREISAEDYVALNKKIIMTGETDLIDIEFFTGAQVVKELVEFAHEYNVKVVISNHDFEKTPSKEEIIERLRRMQELGADLPKIAVMPQTKADVLTLLLATNEMNERYANRPIITMSMSGLGVISRLAGEAFGSALTFGAAKVASAPGQVPVDKLYDTLQIIHESL